MPNINDVYQLPPGSHGVPDTPIQSAKYNAVIDDLANDANTARPVGRGGTGASSAAGARDKLGAMAADALRTAAAKALPIDADSLTLIDSEAEGGLKRVLWSALKVALKSQLGKWSNVSLADMPTDTFKARNGPAGEPQDKTVAEVLAMLGFLSVNPASATGYYKFSDGTILQRGYANRSGDGIIPFPQTFPNACFNVQVTLDYGSHPLSSIVSACVTGVTTSSFGVQRRIQDAGGASGGLDAPVFFMAWGR